MNALARVFALPGSGPWPTVDPFLFCVHHRDAYPAGDGALGPAASLAGRELGMDFSGRDGWSMYHGRHVPGFPAHPHRGFETITWVRRGWVDHADSLGIAARYGDGDVQWLTAGRGIVHAEMFPLLDRHGPNPLDLFQIWLNLPAAEKMSEPHMALLDGASMPVVLDPGGARVRVVVGTLGEADPRPAPPSSWGAVPGNDVAIWHAEFPGAGASWRLPAKPAGVGRTLYVVDGGPVRVRTGAEPPGAGVVVEPRRGAVQGDVAELVVEADAPAELLVLAGRPIGEPVISYGPFVMNDRAQIVQAFADYERTRFGGWPWPSEDPTLGTEPTRLLRRPAA